MAVFYGAWLAVTALCYWLWVALLDRPPPPDGILYWVEGIGGALSALFARYAPVLPFRGKAPEEAAAEAFFAGEDVRSDDHTFERDLKD